MDKYKYLLLLPIALLFVACGEEFEVEENVSPQMVIGKSFNDSELCAGRDNFYLTADWNFRNNGSDVIWSASNSNVTIIKSDRSSTNKREKEVRIKANCMGKTVITASLDGKSTSITLDVLPLADFTTSQNGYKMTFTYVAKYYEFYRAEWYFGDGNSYTAYSDSRYNGVYYTYSSRGTYDVRLLLYDSSGNLIDGNIKTVTLK